VLYDVSLENLDTFVEQLLNGQLTPYLKSEPVPASNDGPVKVGFLHICLKISRYILTDCITCNNYNTCKCCFCSL